MIESGILKVWFSLVLLFCALSGSGQITDNILKREIQIPELSNSLSFYIDLLEADHDIILSFNSQGIDLEREVSLSSYSIEVSQLINELFEEYEFSVISRSDNKLLLIFSNIEKPQMFLTIRGKVYDKSDGEVLIGATIYEQSSRVSTYTNEYGFYSLSIPVDSHHVMIHYIGYKDTLLSDLSKSANDVYLQFENKLDVVNISQKVEKDFVKGTGAEKLNMKNPNLSTGVLGQNDLVELTKSLPGVQSGNEGQTGLYVRGGSPDQNLVLLDGIPLYEVSHAVGLSSIFINESIREANLIKNGFPARYGGRLSSVLNVILKEGNKSEYHGAVNVGPTNGSIHLEGPLSNGKTSFSLAAKKSFLNLYIDDLYTKYTEYDGIGVDFYDVTVKLSHNFSPSRKFILSYYKGRDNFSLLREETFTNESDSFNSVVKNKVDWGSEIINAQFSNVISDNFFINFSLGGSRYDFLSRSAYTFESRLGDLLSKREYDLRSITEIVDYIASVNLDYFATEKHRFKFGSSFTVHNYRPAIQQNDIIVDEIPDSVLSDDILVTAEEYGLYAEDTYSINEKWEMYFGIHLSGFSVGEDSYQNLQPRFKLVYQPNDKNRLDFAYTNTAQYVHLLVNPGTGLPSDLWVPSTQNIKPKTARQLSVSYTRLITNNLKVSIAGYVKSMENVLEYKSPVDLVFAVVNQIPTIDDSPWEERVESGDSESRGIEFLVDYKSKTWSSWLSYALTKTDRLFTNVNDGLRFPYKYDRRHDLNMGVKYMLNKNLSLTTKWVYGEGNLFSLSLEQSVDVGGAKIINPGKRNNYQLPAFHHLDVMLNYNKTFKSNHKIGINLGVYNVYSRLNGFYVYIFENPLEGKQYARKVSIFPILPQLSFSFTF